MDEQGQVQRRREPQAGDEDALRRDKAKLREEILSRFPKDSLLEVKLWWQLSDDPRSQAVEPNSFEVRLVPRGPEEYNEYAGQMPGEGGVPKEVYGSVANGFWDTHEAIIHQLARDLKTRVAERVRVGVYYGGFTRGWVIADPSPLTPVMARLDRTDLETLDALIAAGCAPNRADAIRWALARVRERPAYEQLVTRVRELQALRAEL